MSNISDQGPCVRYDAEKQILIATPFHDWTESWNGNRNDYFLERYAGGTCSNHADAIVMVSGLFIVAFPFAIAFVAGLVVCLKHCKRFNK